MVTEQTPPRTGGDPRRRVYLYVRGFVARGVAYHAECVAPAYLGGRAFRDALHVAATGDENDAHGRDVCAWCRGPIADAPRAGPA